MAALNDALKTLAPIEAADIPQSPNDLKQFMTTTFQDAQILADSVPLPPPANDSPTGDRPRSSTVSSIASNSSEITLSDARPTAPGQDVEKLQKAWGKPIRLNAKDNPLGMAVYKLAGNDGKGAWFARRSIHEGLGFSRWKRGLEREFPETVKVQGGPGEGNIRGIGGERVVDHREVEGVGKVDVYHLSAQFPGPTTPRDFVTLLMTSDNALSEKAAGVLRERESKEIPRHFMVISKPCIHPEAPTRTGFIRGQYQSVELIREVPVPRQRAQSASMNDLTGGGQSKNQNGGRKRAESTTPDLGRDAILRNAKKSEPLTDEHGDKISGSEGHQSHATRSVSAEGRRRGKTISFAGSRGSDAKGEHLDVPEAHDERESNPVEWIMLTRSDPGGSVPRFMVERGTPGSIVADAAKFLDWACAKEMNEFGGDEAPSGTNEDDGGSLMEGQNDEAQKAARHASLQKEVPLHDYETNGHLAGLDGVRDPPPNESYIHPYKDPTRGDSQQDSMSTESSNGLLSLVSSAASTLASHTPTIISAHLPSAPPLIRRYSTSSSSSSSISSAGSFASAVEGRSNSDADTASLAPSTTPPPPLPPRRVDSSTSSFPKIPQALDASSTKSSIASAGGTEIGLSRARARAASALEKERTKLEDRKRKQAEKLRKAREKGGEGKAIERAEEKYEREVKREEGRYEKEVERVERRREREERKEREKRKKAEGGDEDELVKLRREVQVLQVERDLFRTQVGELQKENTRLAVGIGRLEGGEAVLREVREGRAAGLGVSAAAAAALGGGRDEKENEKP